MEIGGGPSSEGGHGMAGGASDAASLVLRRE